MPDERESLDRGAFANTVREAENSELSTQDHHPHGGYTPAAFRHYIRQIALLSTLEGLEFTSVLDVGCSEGYFGKLVRDRFATDVWGVDLSTVALAKAHQNYGL